MVDYEVRGKDKQSQIVSNDIDPSVIIDGPKDSEKHHLKSSDLLSKERLHGLGSTGRKRLIFRPWTIVATVAIFVVISIITASTLLVSKHWHQYQRSKLDSSIGPNEYKSKFGLNFPREYPKLDPDRSTKACRKSWHSLSAIPCHEEIWSRRWDYGRYDNRESELNRFLTLICKEKCTVALREAKSMISNSCDADDIFNSNSYQGRFNVTILEPSPVAVMDLLVARQTHDCRTSPIGDAERGYCMTDLQERWDIHDGLLVEPLHGIDEFLLKTNRHRTEPATRMLGMTGGAGWIVEHNYMCEERKFGPGRGETTCSYCTLEWLGRKMKTWKPNMIYYEDGLPMELPVYIERISKAGRRCAGDKFTSMWADAIDHYEELGLLDREGEWLRQPSGNKLYLFQHGPSAGDSPLPETRDYLEEMGDWQSSHPYLSDKESEELDHYTSCLQGLHEEILSMTCYPFLSIEDLASNVLDTPENFQSSCTNDCETSIQRLKLKTYRACPEFVSDGKYYRTQHKEFPFSLYEWREMIFSKSGSLASADKACGWNQADPSCGMVFAQFNRPTWITQTEIDAHEFEQAVRVALETRLPALSTNASVWDPETNSEDETKDRKSVSDDRTKSMEYSVCSPCVWQQFAGPEYWPTNLASLKSEKEVGDWARTMRMLYDACAARDVFFNKSEISKINRAVVERLVGRSIRASIKTCKAGLTDGFMVKGSKTTKELDTAHEHTLAAPVDEV